MIIPIALGIVLAVVILRLLPVMAGLAAIAGALMYQVVRYVVLSIFLGIMKQIRAVRFRGSVAFGLFLSAVIVLFFALTR